MTLSVWKVIGKWKWGNSCNLCTREAEAGGLPWVGGEFQASLDNRVWPCAQNIRQNRKNCRDCLLPISYVSLRTQWHLCTQSKHSYPLAAISASVMQAGLASTAKWTKTSVSLTRARTEGRATTWWMATGVCARRASKVRCRLGSFTLSSAFPLSRASRVPRLCFQLLLLLSFTYTVTTLSD